jgi:hypothetical protein
MEVYVLTATAISRAIVLVQLIMTGPLALM